MAAANSDSREQKKKRKQLRVVLVELRQQLKRACGTFADADEWYAFVQELRANLKPFEDVLTAAQQQDLTGASQLSDATRKGIQQACKVLELELDHVIKGLPKEGGLLGLLGGAILVLAVLVAIAVIIVEASSVSVVIKNNGCATIPVPGELPFYVPGVSLPKLPIPQNGQGTLKAPPLTIGVDATRKGSVTLSAAGVSFPLAFVGSVDSITLDGKPILGQNTTVNLGERAQHELVVTCK